jgi:hypothetical protein
VISKTWRSIVTVIVGGALVCAANAQGASRPRVALALAGGGAKGAAHIGVIQVLAQLHVPVDCVVGTSMGALVGATFASGVTANELQRAVLAIDWKTVGGQRPPRSDADPAQALDARRLEPIGSRHSQRRPPGAARFEPLAAFVAAKGDNGPSTKDPIPPITATTISMNRPSASLGFFGLRPFVGYSTAQTVPMAVCPCACPNYRKSLCYSALRAA